MLPMNPNLNKLPRAGLLILALLMLSSCAELQQHAETARPNAELVATRLTAISFDQADLEFELAVENKNPLPLRLSGMDYDFKLGNQSLVSGISAQGLKLEANATSKVSLPVTVKFADLKKLVDDWAGKDRVGYELQTRFRLQLPVIGEYAIPVSRSGELPAPKIPTLKLNNISLKSLSFSGASIVASVEVDNPNAFELAIKRLNYRLKVNGAAWGEGQLERATKVSAKSNSTLEIPLSLDLLSMGSAAYELLNNHSAVEYRLTGIASLDTSLEMLKNIDLPVDVSGTAKIR